METNSGECDTVLLGATGLVGVALRRRLRESGHSVMACSRKPEAVDDRDRRIRWHRLELGADFLPPARALISAGPLDLMVAALSRSPLCRPQCVVALSSSSAEFKRASPDAEDRRLAQRLQDAEIKLQTICLERAARCVILRPTLIYAGTDDAGLASITRLARRVRCVPLPRSTQGLRMPIHAEDLACTMLAALDRTQASGTYAVGGGETLDYRSMVNRVLKASRSRAPVLVLPDTLYRLALRIAHGFGALRGLSPAIIGRMGEDLVVDDAGARDVLDHAPGPFRPSGRA